MGLVIRASDGADLGDAHRLDETFLVQSELSLFVEGGVIRYEVIPVPPYEKRYAEEEPSVDPGAPGKAVFLADLDGSVAGRIVLSEGWNRTRGSSDIAVDARRRRAGVGRALIDRAVAWAVERGLPGVRAETQSNNVPACKFYESCGFRLGGFDRDLYRGLDEGTTEVALFWYLQLRGRRSLRRPMIGGGQAEAYPMDASRTPSRHPVEAGPGLRQPRRAAGRGRHAPRLGQGGRLGRRRPRRHPPRPAGGPRPRRHADDVRRLGRRDLRDGLVARGEAAGLPGGVPAVRPGDLPCRHRLGHPDGVPADDARCPPQRQPRGVDGGGRGEGRLAHRRSPARLRVRAGVAAGEALRGGRRGPAARDAARYRHAAALRRVPGRRAGQADGPLPPADPRGRS